MKKTIALLLGLTLILGFALIACGEKTTDEGTDTGDAVASTESTTASITLSADAITPADAKALGDGLLAQYEADGSPEDKTPYVVADVDVGGPVFAVKNKGSFAIVSLGDDAAPFNILITNEVFEAADLTLEDLEAWIGQTVEVTGDIVVNSWGSLTEMQLTDMSQMVYP